MIHLGIGEFGATRTPGDQLITYALGSCVALLIIDPDTGTVGMAHIALPKPSENARRPAPGYYATDAVPGLMRQMAALGVNLRSKRLIAKLIGGASVIDGMSRFDIGKRNVLAVRKLLWRHRLVPQGEDVGGQLSRTVRIGTGRPPALTISNPEHGTWTV